MEQEHDSCKEFPVFKGLQRPLEFLGFQGRYIVWAALTAGGSILSFFICFISFGFLVALIVVTSILAFGSVMIFLKQRKGLHSKKEEKGIFIFAHSRRIY